MDGENAPNDDRSVNIEFPNLSDVIAYHVQQAFGNVCFIKLLSW